MRAQPEELRIRLLLADVRQKIARGVALGMWETEKPVLWHFLACKPCSRDSLKPTRMEGHNYWAGKGNIFPLKWGLREAVVEFWDLVAQQYLVERSLVRHCRQLTAGIRAPQAKDIRSSLKGQVPRKELQDEMKLIQSSNCLYIHRTVLC